MSQRETTPLHEVALRGGADVIQALLKKGADVMVRDEHGKTPPRLSPMLTATAT